MTRSLTSSSFRSWMVRRAPEDRSVRGRCREVGALAPSQPVLPLMALVVGLAVAAAWFVGVPHLTKPAPPERGCEVIVLQSGKTKCVANPQARSANAAKRSAPPESPRPKPRLSARSSHGSTRSMVVLLRLAASVPRGGETHSGQLARRRAGRVSSRSSASAAGRARPAATRSASRHRAAPVGSAGVARAGSATPVSPLSQRDAMAIPPALTGYALVHAHV